MIPESTIRENSPVQARLLSSAAELLAGSPAVSRLSVRGSLAAGKSDRMSDIDFVIGVRDDHFAEFCDALDDLMAAELGAIFPGWHDIIVRDLGGLGYVYLVTSGNGLYQIDTYVVPDSEEPGARRRTRAQTIYADPTSPPGADAADAARRFIGAQRARTRSCSELLVEILTLAHMLSKRVRRGQHFIAFDHTYLLMTAVKDLVKTALAPTSTSWGWYHLEEELGSTSAGKSCLADLTSLISRPVIEAPETLVDTVRCALRIASRAAPESVQELSPALESYLYYLESA